MARFSKKSIMRRDECHQDLIAILDEAIKVTDFTILCGFRSAIEQESMFLDKKSKLRWPDSKHNKQPSLAVDIAPWPIDWDNRERFIMLAGIIRGIAHVKDIKIRWGGDWDGDGDLHDQTFYDLVHFELI